MASKIGGIRQTIAYRTLLQKEASLHRSKLTKNKGNSKTALILIDYQEQFIAQVKTLSNWMTKQSIDYSLLVYFPSKKYPDSLVAAERVHFFTPADCNFWGSPNQAELDKIMKTPYDILIEFDAHPSFQLEWICRLSKSPFKIGRNSTKKYLDLMIQGNDQNDQEYMQQIIHWLENIKTT
jgi:hypothetical protein